VAVSLVFTVLIVFALVDEASIRWSRYRDDAARRAAAAKVAHEQDDVKKGLRRSKTPSPTLQARILRPPGADLSQPERASSDVAYYARRYGYACERHRAVTKDGFVLELFRITRADVPARRRAVVLQHGLFMSPGIFVTNEEESLAFVLADLGCAPPRWCWWSLRARTKPGSGGADGFDYARADTTSGWRRTGAWSWSTRR